MDFSSFFFLVFTTGGGFRGDGLDSRGYTSRLSPIHFVLIGIFMLFLFVLIFTFKFEGGLSLGEKMRKTKLIKGISLFLILLFIGMGIFFLSSLSSISFHF